MTAHTSSFFARYRKPRRKPLPESAAAAARRRALEAEREKESRAAQAALWTMLARLTDPGERCTIDEWAEENLQMPLGETRLAGPLSFAQTPYSKGACRALTHQPYRRVLLVWGSQIGKNIVGFIWDGWKICKDPGPNFKGFVTQGRAKKTMKRLIRFIKHNPVILAHANPGRNSLLPTGLSFDRMEVIVSWAGSPSSMSSDPGRYLDRDESDKWKHKDKSEGHPLDTSASRVLSFDNISKIFDTTTPALETDDAQRTLDVGTGHEYFVPCPHCGKPEQVADVGMFETERSVSDLADRLAKAGYQTIEFENFIGWQEGDEAAVKANTVCTCIHCKKTWRHDRTLEITHWSVAKWIPKRVATAVCTMRLPSWYRALESCSYGAIMWDYRTRKLDPARLQQWYNEKAARSWKELGVEKSKDDIRKHARGYARDTIPFVPLMIFLTCDIRDNEIHAVYRAWGEHETSALLRYEILVRETNFRKGAEPTGESLRQIDALRSRTFVCSADGARYDVDLTGLDSGYQPDEVYEYCRTRERCVALKGDDAVKQSLNPTRPQLDPLTKKPLLDSCLLVTFNATVMTDRLYMRLNVTEGSPGEWMLYADVGDDYLIQIVANRKEKHVNRWGREEWRYKRFENRPDHLLDCEKEQYVLAQLTNVAEMRATKPAPTTTEPATAAPEVMGRDVSGFMGRFNR